MKRPRISQNDPLHVNEEDTCGKFEFLGELRAHSPSNDKNDHYTHLWSCAFEPKYEGSHPNLVATCGGNTICFVDCATMTVLKKYKHLEKETFTSLAWTVLPKTVEDDRLFSILAAAGWQGDIKLIEPSMLLCYAYLRGHRSKVYALRFSPKNPRWLLSAGRDAYILLWEIGIPRGEALQADNHCICRFDGFSSPVISLDFDKDSSGFLAGFENSDCQYFEIPKEPMTISSITKSQSFYGYEDNYHGSNIDCLHITDKNIVSKTLERLMNMLN
jgi:WD40 repeat protein